MVGNSVYFVLPHLCLHIDSDFMAAKGDSNLSIFEGKLNSLKYLKLEKEVKILTVKTKSDTTGSEKEEVTSVDSDAKLSLFEK